MSALFFIVYTFSSNQKLKYIKKSIEKILFEINFTDYASYGNQKQNTRKKNVYMHNRLLEIIVALSDVYATNNQTLSYINNHKRYISLIYRGIAGFISNFAGFIRLFITLLNITIGILILFRESIFRKSLFSSVLISLPSLICGGLLFKLSKPLYVWDTAVNIFLISWAQFFNIFRNKDNRHKWLIPDY